MSIINKQKPLVVSLDGLSFNQLLKLQRFLPAIGSLSQKCFLTSQTSSPLVQHQAMWAEIFTGKPWFACACTGYAKPLSNLNDTKVISEADLTQPLDLVSGSGDNPALIINMPLLLPDDRFRIWLSDGSMPLMSAVSPQTVAESAPFNAYRVRPFASAAGQLADTAKAVKECLAVERQRLKCAGELLRTSNWQTCFLGISAFDTLQHLLGPDLFELTDLSLWKQIEEFLVYLNEVLINICQLTNNITMISTFHLSPCHARLNLNELLHQGGFCNFAKTEATVQFTLASRRQASQAIANSQGAISPQADAVVAQTTYIDCSTTVASSPVSGQIYINRSSRFTGGIVEDGQAQSISSEIKNYLINYFQSHFAGDADLTVSSTVDILEQTNTYKECPSMELAINRPADLLVYVPGVDFHNTQGQGIVDRLNHPRATHAPGGFALFSQSQPLPQTINTGQLYNILKEAAK